MAGGFLPNVTLAAAWFVLSLVEGAFAAPPPGLTVVEAVFKYIPNKVAAAIFGVLYLCASGGLFYKLIRRRDWWGLCLPIGAFCQGIGFFFRIVMDNNPNSTAAFIVEQLLVVCSPAAYLAFNYILYGRLIVRCVGREYSLIKPERVAFAFVGSDISTFLIQGAGGSMETRLETQHVGSKIFLIGLILQTVSYFIFAAFFMHTHWRVRRARTAAGAKRFSGQEAWWRVVALLYWTSVFIMIRCLYRVIELAQGTDGHLWTHEIYFYCLDSLPLFIVLITYIPLWPGKYLEKDALESWSQSGAGAGAGTGVPREEYAMGAAGWEKA